MTLNKPERNKEDMPTYLQNKKTIYYLFILIVALFWLPVAAFAKPTWIRITPSSRSVIIASFSQDSIKAMMKSSQFPQLQNTMAHSQSGLVLTRHGRKPMVIEGEFCWRINGKLEIPAHHLSHMPLLKEPVDRIDLEFHIEPKMTLYNGEYQASLFMAGSRTSHAVYLEPRITIDGFNAPPSIKARMIDSNHVDMAPLYSSTPSSITRRLGVCYWDGNTQPIEFSIHDPLLLKNANGDTLPFNMSLSYLNHPPGEFRPYQPILLNINQIQDKAGKQMYKRALYDCIDVNLLFSSTGQVTSNPRGTYKGTTTIYIHQKI